VLSPDPRPTTVFEYDGPSLLSIHGPRHDNDHADYRNVKILPTTDELLAVKERCIHPAEGPVDSILPEKRTGATPRRLVQTFEI
jgi:hypothetical protein